MKSRTAKVVIALFMLCAIHACLGKPKWLWMDEDTLDDLKMTRNRNDVESREYLQTGNECDQCSSGSCYGGECVG
jgi:hypothetical protein